MLAADSCIAAGNYSVAYDNYNAAAVYCRTQIEDINAAKDRLFVKINGLREQAETAQQEAEKALDKATRLVSAFYFHENRFALAYNKTAGGFKYYFINENGSPVENLGYWDRLEHFNHDNLAKGVLTDEVELQEFFIDTAGNRYLISTNPEVIKTTTKVLWLPGNDLEELIIVDTEPLGTIEYKLDQARRKANELQSRMKSRVRNSEQALFGAPSYDTLLDSSQDGIQWVNLTRNRLQTIPPSLLSTKGIRVLNLSNNRLEQLTDIGKLSDILSLDIAHNQIKELPDEINQLQECLQLDARSNLIEIFPISLTEIQSLKYLFLNSNRVKSLPNKIGNMTDLEVLVLTQNSLSYLPPDIGNLSKLRILQLSNNQMTELPEQITNLHELFVLDLSNNNLTKLPDSIGDLKELRILKLSGNQIPLEEQHRLKTLLPNTLISF